MLLNVLYSIMHSANDRPARAFHTSYGRPMQGACICARERCYAHTMRAKVRKYCGRQRVAANEDVCRYAADSGCFASRVGGIAAAAPRRRGDARSKVQ